MTPKQKIKKEILLITQKYDKDIVWEELTADNVDRIYSDVLVEKDLHWDLEQDFRCSGESTNLGAPFNRNYEANQVARKLSDGTWISWTYWYGGGKHGNPEEIEWMNEAREVNVEEEEKLVIIRKFTFK